MTTIAAFTVEIANEIPADAKDWNQYRPFKFLCGSVAYDHKYALDTEHSVDGLDSPQQMLSVFDWLNTIGCEVYSWNGSGFGYPVICDAMTDERNYIGWLALNHHDVMFDFFCRHGYAISLNSVANAQGFNEEVDWLEQQELRLPEWRTGANKDDLFDYSRRKTELLLNVVLKIRDVGGITWFNRAGAFKMETIDRILNVKEAMALPEPDVSWLPDPWSRSKFTGWME